MPDLSSTCIGFLGCGKISSAVCRGFAGADGVKRPMKIIVSQRSTEKSKQLQADFPDLVFIAESNEALVAEADIIFIGLLPAIARDILPLLVFDDKLVVSMMAAVDLNEILALTKVHPSKLVKTVPLPSASKRSGPVLVHPSNPVLEDVLSIVSSPIVCESESDMKPLISVTGHISSFFELMRTTQDFVINNGIDPATARQFTTSFYSSLAKGAESSHESLDYLCEEAATPGGLNEQSWKALKNTDHFKLHTDSLNSILNRLKGK